MTYHEAVNSNRLWFWYREKGTNQVWFLIRRKQMFEQKHTQSSLQFEYEHVRTPEEIEAIKKGVPQ